ncbi:MAG: ABC transporter permease [Beijerinckiaceae bacterium]|jgi:peptide/nickel transport system permease protein|nr:ABC transporter permease [Beijerinckiaceae bacterium]
MISFLARRLVTLLTTLLVAAIVIFGVTEILPGDPAAVMLGLTATPETVAALRTELGLDAPAFQRFFGWIIGFFTGDLGISYAYRVPVAGLIAERLQVTLPLALMASFLAATLGITLGALAASRANSLVDSALMASAQVGLAIPNFWFGILMVLLFSITLGWFPAGGFPGWETGFLNGFHALFLPACALALPQAAVLARLTRTAVLEALGEDFVRTARAKGLNAGQTLRRHVLRNAMVPVVTMLALQFSFLITGTIIIENVFALPGLGRLIFQSVGGHDLVTVKSLVMIYVGAVILVNALVDMAYGLIDPRLRFGRGVGR